MKLELTKLSTIMNGEVFYSLPEPTEKIIDSVKYIEVTPDFKRFRFMRADTLKKVGKVTKNVP